MKARLLIILSAMTVIVLLFLASVYSGEGNKLSNNKMSEKLVIAHMEIFGTLERSQVVFDHGLHAAAFKKDGCEKCHTLTPEGNYIFDFPFSAATRTAKEIEDLYHEKCINCHKKVIRGKNKALPVRCGDCHVKKFEALTIKYPVFEFDFAYHDKHVKTLKEKKGKDDCGACHHTYDPLEEDESLRLIYEQGTEESCYYCHDLEKKRGPKLSAITQAAAKKGLSMKKVAHMQCVNCHLSYIKAGDKAGPVACMKCHTGKYKTVRELAEVPRPGREQPKRPFISIEDAKMKGVSFDHAFHEKNTKTCRSCHHETLQACKKCHGMVGSPEGKWVSLTNAYHDASSDGSCAGCHKKSKSGKKCAGCHHNLPDIDIQSKGPKKETCTVCHSGKKEGLITGKRISVASLDRKKVPEEVTIKILEKQYGPSKFPHIKIIRKLAEVSNDSKLAASFHRTMQTTCRGCHHQSTVEAEAKDNKPPYCRNCHSIVFDTKNPNRPRLLAAYHRQCLTCHEKMDIKEKGCADCHKEKVLQPKDLLTDTDNMQTISQRGV
ncbi:MAG: cytochrome c3 family protein [Thermodesulfovibrionales bacterium]|jgi:hypothetical protein